jgi:hypothetical protein
MDSSVTRSKSEEFVFLSGHLTERVYAVLPNRTDDLMANIQVDATKIDAMGQRTLQKTSYWLLSSVFKLKGATSKNIRM